MIDNKSIRKVIKMKKGETVEKAEAFSKSSILMSKRFSNRKDALSFLLEDEESYTIEQVDKILDDYMKGQVK